MAELGTHNVKVQLKIFFLNHLLHQNTEQQNCPSCSLIKDFYPKKQLSPVYWSFGLKISVDIYNNHVCLLSLNFVKVCCIVYGGLIMLKLKNK